MKTCSVCQVSKNTAEFSRCVKNKDGLQVRCKQCWKEYSSAYYATERGRRLVAERSRKWHFANLEKHRILVREWGRKNKDKRAAYWKKHYYANQERMIFKATQETYRRRGAEGKFTKEDIQKIHSSQEGKCVYCEQQIGKYHIDHKVPISKGGTSWPSNLQLCCAFCNISKKDRERPVSRPSA